MSNAFSNVIPFPVASATARDGVPAAQPPEKSIQALREAVWTLNPGDLTRVGIMMSRYIDEALQDDAETDFYERAKAAFAIYERILIEGDRLPMPPGLG